MRATEVLWRNSKESTTYTETKMNAETRIIGLMSCPITCGTAKRSTAKAAISPRPMAIFLGSAFGCAAPSKTDLADNY
jgi:hypothetical protein